MFDDLALKFDFPYEGGFLVSAVTTENLHDQAQAHLAAGYVNQCTAVVWPELTVSPKLRREIRRTLARSRLERPNLPIDLQFACTGSWHESVGSGGIWVNRAAVYDRYGTKFLHFDKLSGVHVRDLGSEAITESKVAQILVLEDQIFAFGICRDFCDVSEDNIFPHLDADYFIVPSMGGKSTLKGHLETAKLLALRFTARSFVVQQAYPLEPDKLGFAVPPLEDLSKQTVARSGQVKPWKVYQAG